MKITLSHGSGGKATSELIDKIFARSFSNPILNMMEDSAVVDGHRKIAITTDSFVVTPLFFNGDRKSTRLNSSHITRYRMPSSA